MEITPGYSPQHQTSGGKSPGNPTTSRHPKQRPQHKELSSFLLIIASALVFAGLLISFVFQAYTVDGPSMEETLQNGDRLIVVKTARTWARITGNIFIPERGDVIVFNSSGITQPDQTGKKQLIKRVVGLPGERVIVQSGKLTIVNEATPGGFNPDEGLKQDADILNPVQGDIDLVVPENQLFVMGDNRSQSQDSRYFGTIAAESVVGVLALRILPLSDMRSF